MICAILATSYVYDSLDQLTRENNQAAGKTWVYTYDNGGNILTKKEYDYTTGTLGTELNTFTFGYDDSSWKDLLTSYGWKNLTSDAIGNLINDGDWTYTWQHGRQLEQMLLPRTIDRNREETVSFTYDAQGRRIGKHHESALLIVRTDGDYIATTTRDYSYHYLNDTLTQMKISTLGGNTTLHFTYDAIGPMSVNYDGTEYYYLRNAQGDVTGLVDADGTQVVTYTYDAWGNPLSVTGSKSHTIGKDNPFRYRGYFYDAETGLYYLNSRYYNPKTARFINADEQLNNDMLGNNMFTYCSNNPVVREDNGGRGWWIAAGILVGGLIGGAAKVATNIAQGKKWNTGLWGAVCGGAMYGFVITKTGNLAMAAFASSAVESAVNEITSYVPKLSELNNMPRKEVTKDNIVASVETVIVDTVVNGAIATGTGLLAINIIPTNPGWFTPQKFVSAFAGKYAVKSELQSLVQAGLNMLMEGYKAFWGIGSNASQQRTVPVFPAT